MPDSTPLSPSPRKEILHYLRAFARVYQPEANNEAEARETARCVAYPLGTC